MEEGGREVSRVKTAERRFPGRHRGSILNCGELSRAGVEGRSLDADLETPDGMHLLQRDGTLLADDLAVFLAHGPLPAHGLVVRGHLEGGFLAPGAHGRHRCRVETAVERAKRRATGRVARVNIMEEVLARLGTWRGPETASRRGV